MAVSTTIASGKNSDVRVDNASGVLTNISGSSNVWDATAQVGQEDYFVFESDWRFASTGGRMVDINLTTLYSPTTDEGADLLLTWYTGSPETARSLRIDFDDAVGEKRFEGEFKIVQCTTGASAGQGGPAQVQAQLKSHGPVTITTTST